MMNRKMDELGRVVLPREVCEKINLKKRDLLEIGVFWENRILLTPLKEKFPLLLLGANSPDRCFNTI